MIKLIHFKDTRYQLLTIAWLIISLIITIEMKVISIYRYELGYADKTIIIYFFIQFLAGLLLIRTMLVPIYDWINNYNSRIQRITLLFFHGLVFGLMYTITFSLIYEIYNMNTVSETYIDRLIHLLITDFHNSIRTYLIFIAILIGHDYFIKHTLALSRQKTIENHINKIKLQALRNHLQPHFLFNALNNVVALIEEDTSKAQAMIISLSDLLRHSIEIKPDKMITINEEVAISNLYLDIERLRYDNQLNVTWYIEDNVHELMLPPLVLQPLLENAIKHGFVDHCDMMTIEIVVQKDTIIVRNNGAKLVEPQRYGTGIKNIVERLDIQYMHRTQFHLYMKDDWIINQAKTEW